MPEGDTIYRAAQRLKAVLERQPVTGITGDPGQTWSDRLTGQEVTRVESRGKHLLLHFADGHVLHSHLGMTGSWRIYLPGQAWGKPARRAGICLHTPTHACVCFSPKTLELLTAAQFSRHRWLGQLGPDLLAAEVDWESITRRARQQGPTTIGEVLMNQAVASGIGNVYKSELLYLTRLSPFRPTRELTDEQLFQLYQLARQQLLRNRATVRRRTRFRGDGGRLWVYRRAGLPCYHCGTPIRMGRQGQLGRSTYWCPACQPQQ